MPFCKRGARHRARWTQCAAKLTLIATSAALSNSAYAGTANIWGIDADWSLQAAYVFAVRTEAPDNGIINSPPAATIPLPDYLKVPESNNFDDGDRSFKQWTPINNRITGLGEIHLVKDNYDLVVRGDAFYDNVYRRANDNNSPNTINKYGPDGTTHNGADFNHFTADSMHFDGMRARLLDAYISGNWTFGDDMALNVRAGQHVVAWGESLFFNGIALTQGPADATKATIPGADVKSILLPVPQVSFQFSPNNRLTLLGQYKLRYKETELNPVGEFFSVADVVGPGREFIWGIKNPLNLGSYEGLNLSSPQEYATAANLVAAFLVQNGTLPESAQTGALTQVANALAPVTSVLPAVPLPGQVAAISNAAGAPEYINVRYAGDLKPSAYGQYGVGMKYAITSSTTGGIYYLRYHETTPSPVQNYSSAENPVLLQPSPAGDITSETIGITIPYSYNIKYFDGVKMFAGSLSTELFGLNFGAEAIYRRGAAVLVNVDGGITGPIPTPTRANVGQLNINALYISPSSPWWDAITLVADFGINRVLSIDPVASVAKPSAPLSTDLKFSTTAWGYTFLWFIDRKNIFDGWDLQIPMTFAGIGHGQSSLLAGLGSLMGQNDRRASVGVNFTRLAALQLGISYSAYLGSPDFSARPYQDRDNLGLVVKYNF
ncbi:MAG: DUF1302 family protein [Pseudomonadota bacterium]